MLKVNVCGALGASKPEAEAVAAELGRGVIEQGYILLSGCRNEFDKLVAQSAFEYCKEKGIDAGKRIISYVADGSTPAHEFGTILKSRLSDWDGLAFKRLYVPEPIGEADTIIFVGGTDGTLCAANWARMDKKPLLPITTLGGAAADIYNEEVREFETKYADHVEKSEYEVLNQISSDCRKIVRDAISLVAKTTSSRQVAVVMSYSDDARLNDAYDSFVEVCEDLGYKCSRVDHSNTDDRIVSEIFARIKKSAFVIADLSEAKPNVYYELGFAQGARKRVIVTAVEGTPLPFDVNDLPVLFWEGQRGLKSKLKERIEKFVSARGDLT